MEKIKENNKILNIIILVIFITLSLIVGANHEPWADEAQAWLLARDSSISSIVFESAKYEGTPVLWQIVLKFFIALHLPYNLYYIVPIIFSSIGVYIFLFKLKINNLYKVLIPFSYFVGFEYTIKARSYCMLFPILVIIAYLYENRKNHIYLYNFFILLLAFVSLHGTIISGVLYLFEIIEIINGYSKTKKIKDFSKEIISIVFISLCYIFIVATVLTPKDIYVNIALSNIGENQLAMAFVFWIIRFLEAFTLKIEALSIGAFVSGVIVAVLFICVLWKNRNKALFLFLIILPFVFISFVRVSDHHVGIFFLSFLFGTYLVKDGIQENLKKIFIYLFTIVLCIQVIWYFDSAKAEIETECSAGKTTAEYVKSLNYEDKEIYGSGYYVISILPYFSENIFNGERGAQTYYTWSKNNLDWVRSSDEKYLYDDDFIEEPDIIILDDHLGENPAKGYVKLIHKIRESGEYKETHFPSTIIFKGIKDGNGTEGFFVFERVK